MDTDGGSSMAERVSVSVDGYEFEYSREPVLRLIELAQELGGHDKSLGGVGWSGRAHAWALIPRVTSFDPEGWMLVATEPETGMLGRLSFGLDGTLTEVHVADVTPLAYDDALGGLVSGWVNALRNADPGHVLSSQGDILFRRSGDAEWRRKYLRVGSECGGSGMADFI